MKVTEINQAVLRDYPRYEKIVTDWKRLKSKNVEFSASQTHKTNQVGNADVYCEADGEDCKLNVDVNVERQKTFRFRLFCKTFMKEPCVHFDSDGCAHERPSSPDCPLRQRMVRTPHFHRYDEKGRNIPYRTAELDVDEEAILCNVHRAFALFCNEENSELPELPLQGILHEKAEFNDPLEGVPFL